MSIDRITRVNELLKREIAAAFYKILPVEGRVDMAALTVTHVTTSRNLRYARVMISILGHEHERGTILHEIRNHRVEIQQWINHNVKLKFTPQLDFHLDTSVEQGDHVLGILKSLEDEHMIPPYDPYKVIEDAEEDSLSREEDSLS